MTQGLLKILKFKKVQNEKFKKSLHSFLQFLTVFKVVHSPSDLKTRSNTLWTTDDNDDNNDDNVFMQNDDNYLIIYKRVAVMMLNRHPLYDYALLWYAKIVYSHIVAPRPSLASFLLE